MYAILASIWTYNFRSNFFEFSLTGISFSQILWILYRSCSLCLQIHILIRMLTEELISGLTYLTHLKSLLLFFINEENMS